MKTADQAANTTTSRPAALESLEKLIANRLDRIDRLALGAWRELSPGNMNQARCQELARLAVRQANLAARDVRRVWVLCRPAPGWARRARQRLMVARMELGELDRHRERSCSPVGGVGPTPLLCGTVGAVGAGGKPPPAEPEKETMHHEDRIATYKENARKARARANADLQSADNHSARFQGGQPILAGHHSEKSAHRARSRADAAMRRYIKNQQAAQYWERKARAAEQHQKQKHDPGVIQRRIARMEAEQRQIDRQHEQAEGHHAEQLNEQSRKLTQELEKNRTELEDTDAKIWGREDFNKGDYAHHDGTWYEIKRVNAKSVTVAAIVGSDHARLQLGGSQVYRLQDNPYPWTDTLTYTKITGRISAQDMADKMPQ